MPVPKRKPTDKPNLKLASCTVRGKTVTYKPPEKKTVARQVEQLGKLLKMVVPVPEEWTDGEDGDKESPLVPMSFDQLAEAYPKQSPVIVEGIARAGEVVNIIGGSKSMKSWLAASLCLALCNGKPWLGYTVTKGKVLLIDNELRPNEIVARISALTHAMGVSAEGLDVLSLRGRLTDYAGLANGLHRPGHFLKESEYVAVICDAHYRMLGAGADENSNGQMKDAYNQLDRMAEQSGAAWFLVHHTTKGNQSDKQITDVGAGAGAQSRAADGHLILRPHTEPGAMVLEAVVRSFAPPEPKVLRWQYPLWVPDVKLNPADLRTLQTQKKARRDDVDRQRVLEALTANGPATANVLARTRLDMGVDRCRRLLGVLVTEGLVTAQVTLASGNETTLFSPAKQGLPGYSGVAQVTPVTPGGKAGGGGYPRLKRRVGNPKTGNPPLPYNGRQRTTKKTKGKTARAKRKAC